MTDTKNPAPQSNVSGIATLDDLLDDYFSIAYQQGKEGRDHDDIRGSAQETVDKIRARFDPSRKIAASLKTDETAPPNKAARGPITIKIPPEVYAEANRYAVDVAEGDTKAWFDVRDAIARAIMAERMRCSMIADVEAECGCGGNPVAVAERISDAIRDQEIHRVIGSIVAVGAVVKAADDAIVSAVHLAYDEKGTTHEKLLPHKEVRKRVKLAIEAALSTPPHEAGSPSPSIDMRTVAELPMTSFDDDTPQRNEFNGEQTILTYNANVGIWDLAFFASGEEFPEKWFGDTHWIDISGMWPGVIAQVASFAATEGSGDA